MPPDTPVPDIRPIVDAGVRTLFLVGERDTVVPLGYQGVAGENEGFSAGDLRGLRPFALLGDT